MAITVMVPEEVGKKLREKARERGIIIIVPADSLHHVELQIRKELAQIYLEEGKAEKNPKEASLKLFNAAVEAVKAAALALGLKETWTKEDGLPIQELERTVTKLVEKYGEDVIAWWSAAVVLYDLGYLEEKLEIDRVEKRIPYIQKLVELATKLPSDSG